MQIQSHVCNIRIRMCVQNTITAFCNGISLIIFIALKFCRKTNPHIHNYFLLKNHIKCQTYRSIKCNLRPHLAGKSLRSQMHRKSFRTTIGFQWVSMWMWNWRHCNLYFIRMYCTYEYGRVIYMQWKCLMCAIKKIWKVKLTTARRKRKRTNVKVKQK